MSDLISRQAVLDILSGKNAAWDAYKKVAELPSAERPKGKWLKTDSYPHRIYCSSCYKTYIRNDELLERWEFPMNYCPNCGAEMEKKE